MEIQKTKTGSITLSGRIDSANAAEAEEQIMKICEEGPIVLDAEQLQYISSAGLRILMKLKKKFGDVTVVNVTTDVYEILNVTGFTEILKVEKAFRRMEIAGAEMIGSGSNGEVYRINADTILKVYKEKVPLEDIRREMEFAKKAFVFGIPTAIPFDVVLTENNSYGAVFELIGAQSMRKLLNDRPEDLRALTEKSTAVLREIHAIEKPKGTFPSALEECRGFCQNVKPIMDQQYFEKLEHVIAGIPESCHLLHCDYQPNNIMFFENEEVTLIDMDTLCQGHPVFEMAYMFSALVGYGLAAGRAAIDNFMGIKMELTTDLFNTTWAIYYDNREEEREATLKTARVLGFLRILNHMKISYEKKQDEVSRVKMQNALECLQQTLSEGC